MKVGDLEPPLRLQLKDSDGNPVDLSTGSYTTEIEWTGSPNLLVSAILDESDPLLKGSLGWIEHVWVAGETDVAGAFGIVARAITTVGSRPRTFPGTGSVTLVIEPALSTAAGIVWGNVVDLVPSASTVSVSVQTLILAYVDGAVREDMFCTTTDGRFRLAQLYLAAHHAQAAAAKGVTTGEVISKKRGGLEVKYSPTSPESASTSSYFDLYKLLMSSSAVGRGPIMAFDCA